MLEKILNSFAMEEDFDLVVVNKATQQMTEFRRKLPILSTVCRTAATMPTAATPTVVTLATQ